MHYGKWTKNDISLTTVPLLLSKNLYINYIVSGNNYNRLSIHYYKWEKNNLFTSAALPLLLSRYM